MGWIDPRSGLVRMPLADLAGGCASAQCDTLQVSRLGSFLALTLVGDTSGIAGIAETCVRELDGFRAPPGEEELIRRAQESPKPLYYREEFLEEQLVRYREEFGSDYAAMIEPDEFVRWMFPRLFYSRIPRYESIADRYGYTLTTDELAPLISRFTRLIYLNFPSNPTGGVASRAQLEALSELILEKTPPNVRVYSDEAYEAIVFDGERHVSIASVPGMEERTIIASAVSKTYSWTGGRVGWAVYPTVAEAKVHRNLNINYFASIPPYNQIGTRVALESPESAVAIEEMSAAFQRRRDQVVKGLNEIEGIRCGSPKGAFYAFPNITGVVERLGIGEAWQRLPEETRRESSPATLFALFLLYRYHVATMDRRSFGRLDSDGQTPAET